MKFLVDNQLPAALSRHLREGGFACTHVLDIGMGQAEDPEIWRFVVQERMILITKDEDFVHLASQSGAAAQVVWVRMGNCRNRVLCTAFKTSMAQIVELLRAGEKIIEVR